jgi:hypothetical protein
MGWAGGSIIAERIWDMVRPHIPEKERETIARKFIDIFEQEDCDSMDECEQLYYKDAGNEFYTED